METLTIVSQAVSNTLADVQVDGVLTSKIVIQGDKPLTITAATDALVTTIDASAFTAALTLSAATGYANATITGGSGADVITAAPTGNANLSLGAGNDSVDFDATLNVLDVVDGGAGTDTVIVSAGFTSPTVVGGLSNFEILKLDGAATITLAGNINPTTFDFTTTTDQILNLNDGYTNATAITLSGDGGGDKVVNSANVTLTVTGYVGDFAAGTTLTGGTGTDTLSMLNAVDGAAAVLTGNTTGFETIVITDVTAGADATLTTGAYNLGVGKTYTITASSLDAGEDLTLTGTASVSAFNAVTGAGADTIVLGTGADTLDAGSGHDVITGTAGNNLITAGDGNDTVTIGTGISSVDGGAGNDTIVGGANFATNDTLDGGAGTDTLTIGANITSHTQVAGASNLEVIAPAGGEDITLTGSLGGATTFNFGNEGDNILTTSTGWTADTIVLLTGDDTNADQVINSANVTLTVKGVGHNFDTATIITGGTGTDTIEITVDGEDVDIDGVSAVETIYIKDSLVAGTDMTLLVNEGNLTLLTIDASELDGSVTLDETITITGTAATGKLSLIGGGGADTLLGGTLNDTISGGAGADSINGNEGQDSLSGGAANDTFLLDSKTDFTGALGNDTIDGGAGTDTVTFTGAQNLTAAQLANISNTEVWAIAASSDFTISDAVLNNNPGVSFQIAGNGTLSGGEDTAGAALTTVAMNITSTAAGDLKLIGSSADDSFTFDATESLTADDTIDGNAGTDTIKINNNDDLTTAAGDATAATLGVNHTGIETLLIVDGALDDTAGDVTITIASGYLGATLTVDATALDTDPITAATGEILTLTNSDNVALTVDGGTNRDVITGGSGVDVIRGNGGNDSITGGDAADSLYGNDGLDTILGGAGTDYIEGGAGNDTIKVTTFTDFKTSGGVETIKGGDGTDTLSFVQSNTALTLTAPELEHLYSIEAITLSSGSGVIAVTFGNATFTNLGNASITITGNVGSGTTSIDGSAVTNGAFIMVAETTAADAADTMIGGSGDDIFRWSGTTELIATDVITGNAGNDTIQLDTSAAATTVILDFNDVTGVENVDAYAPLGSAGNLIISILPHAVTALNAGAITVDGSAQTLHTMTFNVTNSVNTVGIAFTVTGGAKVDTITGSLGNDII
ncbi:MAG: calcium-binding protein [Opitutales bacterium]